jgi:DNA polymerase III epsilon subunit-like protein
MTQANNLSIVFDTETTGLLPKVKFQEDWEAVDISIFPYILQLSFITIVDDTQTIVTIHDALLKIPDDVIINPFVTKIHGITNELIHKRGKCVETEIDNVMTNIISCKRIIGHNIEFDINMLLITIVRLAHKYKGVDEDESYRWIHYYNILYGTWRNKCICTMFSTIKLCNIWKQRTNSTAWFLKYPKLSELHNHLFNEEVERLHNSLIDVFVCLRCYYYLEYDVDLKLTNKTLRELYKLIH